MTVISRNNHVGNVDYSGVLSILKQLLDLMTMVSSVPNLTDQAFSNADNASALSYKLYVLDQFAAPCDREFKKGLLRKWEIITNRINLKKNTTFDFRDIDIKLLRNIPTDKEKSIQMAILAKNSELVSQETAINISGLEVDAESEMKKINAEKENSYMEIQSRINEQKNTHAAIVGGDENNI